MHQTYLNDKYEKKKNVNLQETIVFMIANIEAVIECWQVIVHRTTNLNDWRGRLYHLPSPTTHLVGASSVLFCLCTLECTLGSTFKIATL